MGSLGRGGRTPSDLETGMGLENFQFLWTGKGQGIESKLVNWSKIPYFSLNMNPKKLSFQHL